MRHKKPSNCLGYHGRWYIKSKGIYDKPVYY